MMNDIAINTDVRLLVDQYREQCLWFSAEDYYPETVQEMIFVLDRIQRYGGLDAFKKAGALKKWLLQNSSAESAVS